MRSDRLARSSWEGGVGVNYISKYQVEDRAGNLGAEGELGVLCEAARNLEEAAGGDADRVAEHAGGGLWVEERVSGAEEGGASTHWAPTLADAARGGEELCAGFRREGGHGVLQEARLVVCGERVDAVEGEHALQLLRAPAGPGQAALGGRLGEGDDAEGRVDGGHALGWGCGG